METMAGKVRAAFAALSLEGETVCVKDVMAHLDLVTHADKRPVYTILSDMRQRGELTRVDGSSVYQYHPVKKALVRSKMWRILRARKKVTASDLQELSGASSHYAKEWLQMLAKQEIIKKMKGGVYRLIEDPVEEPVNNDRAARLRGWRKQKKQALSALNQASEAIEHAKQALCKG